MHPATNLALLPQADRDRMQLDKQAALLVLQFLAGKITRVEVVSAMRAVPQEHKSYFRGRLDTYHKDLAKNTGQASKGN